MQRFNKAQRLIFLLLTTVLLASPLAAQQKRAGVPKKPATAAQINQPAPTFDTLLSAESYRIYSEVRGVGQLIRSSAVNDLLDPVMKLAGPPREFKTVLKWLNAHADTLTGSRLMVASWPARPNIPNVLVAVEFSSAEEAQKFEPELRGFLPTLMPAPAPTPASSSVPATASAATSRLPQKASEPVLSPYHIKQSGSLVLISDQPFRFRNLKPRGSRLLAEDSNFALARNRFASESVFLYVDIKSIEKEEKERTQKYEEEQRQIETEAASRPQPDESPVAEDPQMNPKMASPELSPREMARPPAEPESVTSSSPQTISETAQSGPTGPVVAGASDPAASKEAEAMSTAMLSLYAAFFGGQPRWPEAIGAGIAFEEDAYIVRTLILNAAENRSNAIPFVPQFIVGPPLVPASAGVFPADSNLFVAASLDYSQIYEGMVKAITAAEESSRKDGRQTAAPVEDRRTESPFAVYEKKLGIKIKDDLLPLLGNEIALALPNTISNAGLPRPAGPYAEEPKAENGEQKTAGPSDPVPVIAISVKDREGLRRLIPKMIESLGFKGANLFAQTEKRDETEITSYASMFSYAFVGDFLVMSPDAAAIRHVVDSYLDHQVLSSDSHFRNSTRWQPRQVLGQVYVAPDLMEKYASAGNEKLQDFLSRLNPVIEPVTYALYNDGSGPLHELHVPKTLLLTLVAGVSSQAGETPPAANEAVAKGLLRTVMSAEATFKETQGNGRYGTLDELISADLLNKKVIQKYGYRIEVAASGNKFEATAVPLEYGQAGRMSYFIDESGVLRGGDHGGGAATLSDKPVE